MERPFSDYGRRACGRRERLQFHHFSVEHHRGRARVGRGFGREVLKVVVDVPEEVPPRRVVQESPVGEVRNTHPGP